MTTGPSVAFPMGAVMRNIEFHGTTTGSRAEFSEMIRYVEEQRVRPIISDKPKDELISFITSHLEGREKFYKQAQVVFQTDHLITKEDVHITVNGIAEEIKKLQK